ncbi:MAG: hypothetical protein M1820_003823 [Bogoriella megaspora]|nr:MAG: hypothetical protein M1820_003823 [Bogoriella megaspora]
MKLFVLASLWLTFIVHVFGLGQNKTITFSAGQGALQLAGDGSSPRILVDGKDYPGVIRAAGDLAADFGRVTGVNGTVRLSNQTASGNSSATIIVGTIGNSSYISNLVKAGKLNISQTEGQWEAFSSQIVSNPISGVASALVIVGADQRGSIYGLYDISEQIGVSPWYWMADSAPQKHDSIYATRIQKAQRSPSVKYRGFFLNDEQPALNNWVRENYPDGKYGPGFNPQFYSRVFELMLRLRANYIWPTEWNSMFSVDDPLNDENAKNFGVVVGTSHTEPLMRWTKEQSLFLNGTWSWANNQQNVTDFMRIGAQRAAPYEHVWTMGMRGLGDTASPTLNAAQLAEIIKVEQGLLQDAFNTTDISDIPQMWCLYKEVGGYFQQGLDVPDDITLLWADDNWGNTQRLPLSNETNRTAGAGVYYHFDYVGGPVNYKWINTINLAKTWEQMHLAYERDARQIWIVNIGDLKGLEVPLSHFLDLAYDAPSYSEPDSTLKWLQLFAAREFGASVANDTAAVMSNYSLLTGRRKFEMLSPQLYSLQNYDEASTVLSEWSDLVDAAQSIYNKLDADAQPAFFEMVLHPALAGYTLHQIHIYAGQNNMYANEFRTSTNTIAQNVLNYFNQDHAIKQRYHSLLDGKWNHIMDQTHMGYDWFQQPMRDILPPLDYVQTLDTALDGNLGVTAEGHNGSAPGDSVYNIGNSNSTQIPPPIDPYGPQSRYIDVYSIGTKSVSFKVSPAASWVKASPSSGTLSTTGNGTDARVYLSVDWSAAPAGSSQVAINVTSSSDYGNFNMPTVLLNVNKTSVPEGFSGFVESDGHISIEAEHTTSNTSAGDVSYGIIPGYGRTLSGVTLFPVTADSQSAPGGPKLSYDFYAFSNASNANVVVYVGPSLNTIPSRPLKYALSIDDGTPQTVQPCPTYSLGTLPNAWNAAVSNAVWTNSTSVSVTPGKHTLNLWALEPSLVFQKVVIDLGGVRPSYLGPPESTKL